jgi:hypothetical protein
MTYDDWKTTDPREYKCEMCGADTRHARRLYCWEPDCPHGLYVDPDRAYDEWRDRQMESR